MGVGVSWRTVAASVIGTSHVAAQLSCQDSCWAQVEATGGGQPVLSIFVADGAGSASHGGPGAELAIQTAARALAGQSGASGFAPDEALATHIVQAVVTAIATEATAQSLTPRDFACTFLGLVSTCDAAVAMQIGDGGIVLDHGEGLHVAITPMGGEYANMTHFVTDEDAMQMLSVRAYAKGVERAAVFSDGLQRLALNMATHTPHPPFFAPFFQSLQSASEEQVEVLPSLLTRFLQSEAVNQRTDDDKTLAIAVRHPAP